MKITTEDVKKAITQYAAKTHSPHLLPMIFGQTENARALAELLNEVVSERDMNDFFEKMPSYHIGIEDL